VAHSDYRVVARWDFKFNMPTSRDIAQGWKTVRRGDKGTVTKLQLGGDVVTVMFDGHAMAYTVCSRNVKRISS